MPRPHHNPEEGLSGIPLSSVSGFQYIPLHPSIPQKRECPHVKPKSGFF